MYLCAKAGIYSIGEIGNGICMLKAVIFDYDDTLVMSSRALFGADSETASLLGLEPAGMEKYFSAWGRPHREMIRILYPGMDYEEYMKTYKTVYKWENVKLAAGVEEALKALKEKGLKLAVLSAKEGAFLEESLKRNRIRHYFDYIHSAESSVYKKPDPRVFDDVVKALKVHPSETAYVGDMTMDFLAASAAHIRFVGVATGIESAEKLRANGCTDVISGIRGIGKLLGDEKKKKVSGR